MKTDYDFLLSKYPEYISKEQLCKICHISKRKAKWLLENGYIPCADSGKKTRRFKIRTADVITFLELRSRSPQEIAAPVGLFNSQYRHHVPSQAAQIDPQKLASFLEEQWAETPDILRTADIVELTGYCHDTIISWVQKGTLPSVKSVGGTVIAKVWLIEFIVQYTIQHPNRLSKTHKELVDGYCGSQNIEFGEHL